LHLVAALLLVVLALHVLEFSGQALDLVLVLVDLGLVHVKLGGHSLHLVRLLLQVLLVDRELFSDFRARLSSQQVLQLDVELLLLLDHHIFLHDFFSLFDETFLQGLDLLEELPGVGVGALQLPPPVVVERVFELLGEGLDLEAFVEELLVQGEGLFLEFVDLTGLGLDDLELTGEVTDLELQETDVLKALLVLDLSLAEGRLENLDLLVEQGQFVVPSDELGAEDVTLVLLR